MAKFCRGPVGVDIGPYGRLVLPLVSCWSPSFPESPLAVEVMTAASVQSSCLCRQRKLVRPRTCRLFVGHGLLFRLDFLTVLLIALGIDRRTWHMLWVCSTSFGDDRLCFLPELEAQKVAANSDRVVQPGKSGKVEVAKAVFVWQKGRAPSLRGCSSRQNALVCP